MKLNIAILISIASLSISSCFKTPEETITKAQPIAPRSYNWAAIADSAQTGLNSNFWNNQGKFYALELNQTAFNGNYWPNAHSLDALTDAYLRKSKDANVLKQMLDLTAGLKAANGNSLINDYYDDMQWMLISTLRAYAASNDSRFKDAADAIWVDVQKGWDEVSGGGFYWRKDKINKNTPANAPACIFLARRYQLLKNEADLTFAKKTYQWLKTYVIRQGGEVWDGIYTNVNPFSLDSRLFTYNYGIVIGSALEMYKITKDASYQTEALQVADACLSRLTRENVLVPLDKGDGGLFNGIFVRYLTRLIIEGDIPNSKKQTYVNFLKNNAEILWSNGTEKSRVLFAFDWKKYNANNVSHTTQLSGVMLMEAVAELKALNLF